MNAQVRKYLIYGAAALVILVAIAVIRGKTAVRIPVEGQ